MRQTWFRLLRSYLLYLGRIALLPLALVLVVFLLSRWLDGIQILSVDGSGKHGFQVLRTLHTVVFRLCGHLGRAAFPRFGLSLINGA